MSALSQIGVRSFAPLVRSAAARPLCRGAPAFRRSRLRHSPPAFTPMAQPQNRVSRRRTSQVFCPLGPFASCKTMSSVKHAPCGPVFLPVDRGPGAARERMAYPRAGTAPRVRLSGLPFRKGALTERGDGNVTEMGTYVKNGLRNRDSLLASFAGARSTALRVAPPHCAGAERGRTTPLRQTSMRARCGVRLRRGRHGRRSGW